MTYNLMVIVLVIVHLLTLTPTLNPFQYFDLFFYKYIYECSFNVLDMNFLNHLLLYWIQSIGRSLKGKFARMNFLLLKEADD